MAELMDYFEEWLMINPQNLITLIKNSYVRNGYLYISDTSATLSAGEGHYCFHSHAVSLLISAIFSWLSYSMFPYLAWLAYSHVY